MKMIALKEIGVIKPPFKTTVHELVQWVQPVTVSVKGSGSICGGLMIQGRLLVTSQAITSPTALVQFTDDSVVNSVFSDYKGDNFLSGYAMDEDKALPDWVGLPNRTDPIKSDTYLFSYVHDRGRDYVVRYQVIDARQSEAFGSVEAGKPLQIDCSERKSTYPLVDKFGFLVGVNIGWCEGETLCQPIRPKNKL